VVARLKPSLEKEGYVVETFTDSRKAKDRIEENKFDVIVTDLKMANIDGLQLFRFAKQRWPDTEVILISGFTTMKIAQEALQEGIREVIAKPFKISHIKEVINKIGEDLKS
jgi:DNA-binding NtrC family response regulator